jgi:hypothetical protein
MDTLAFDYRIPIITAPSGLSPFGNEACPAHQSNRFSEAGKNPLANVLRVLVAIIHWTIHLLKNHKIGLQIRLYHLEDLRLLIGAKTSILGLEF